MANVAAHRRAHSAVFTKPTRLMKAALTALVCLSFGEAAPGVPHTAHGGRNWARREANTVLRDNDKYAWIYAVGARGMIMTSRDAGDTWLPLDSGVTVDLFDVMFIDARNGLVVGADSTVLSTSNLGNEWETLDILPHKARLNGVWIMVSGGPTYIVGEKGLFISSGDGTEFEHTSLVCTTPGTACTQTPFIGANTTSSLNLYGARFRDPDNGILVGDNGVIIIVRGGSEEGDRSFHLKNPVKVNVPGITSTSLPSFYSIVSLHLCKEFCVFVSVDGCVFQKFIVASHCPSNPTDPNSIVRSF